MNPDSNSILIRAIENNLFSALPAFGRWPKAEIHDEDHLLWSITDIPFPLFNNVLRARLVPEEIDITVHARMAQAQSRNVPLLWWIGPATQPPDLGGRLERHGFVHEDRMPGMALELAEMNDALPMPSGLIIRQAKDPADLKQWSHVCGEGFGMPGFAAEGFYDLMTYVDPLMFRAYLGWLNDKPVATSLIIRAAGAAGIYNVTTLPEARRKGIGAMMTAVPLREAGAEGYGLGILYASEMGAGVYRSLGFKEYCKIDQYVWAPEPRHDLG